MGCSPEMLLVLHGLASLPASLGRFSCGLPESGRPVGRNVTPGAVVLHAPRAPSVAKFQ